APRLRHPPARGGRRPARDPGAAGTQLALDHADLQPRRRPSAAPRVRPGAPAIVTRDRDLDGFLALLATRRAQRTVDAYRRDLTHLAARLGRPLGSATTDDLRTYLAELRADGLAPATISRRVSAARAFYAHQVLLGTRTENPAADLESTRRRPKLPRTLSPREAERLIDAAAGTTPRALRDAALVELLYGAGLRVSEAVGLER